MNKIVYINSIILVLMSVLAVSYLIYKAYKFDMVRRPLINKDIPAVTTGVNNDL